VDWESIAAKHHFRMAKKFKRSAHSAVPTLDAWRLNISGLDGKRLREAK